MAARVGPPSCRGLRRAGPAGGPFRPRHPAFYVTNSNPGEVDKLPDGSLYPSAAIPKSIYIGAAQATDYANVTVNVAKAGTYWLSAHFASQPNEIKCHVRTNHYHAWRF